MAHSEYSSDPQTPATGGERLRVARIGKPHGIRGEVTVQLYTDEPAERLAPGSELLIAPGPDTARRDLTTVTVARQRWNKTICLLAFEEIPDRNGAEALRGSILSVDTSTTEDDDDEGWYSHELEGMRCVDNTGRIYGTVAELITGPAQDILVVRTSSGAEVMVPFVEELVPEVDTESSEITLNPPLGLFEDTNEAESVESPEETGTERRGKA